MRDTPQNSNFLINFFRLFYKIRKILYDCYILFLTDKIYIIIRVFKD